ncbi:MAG TPA: MFS transporter [Solirubrobacter sp.]|nr:MFS transporter [Solirubrobacter sp.]
MAGLRRALVAIAAALALADASIVALALPPILVEMDTTISGVAAIVGVYALVIALAIVPAERLGPRAGPYGLGLFALASVGCAVAGSLWLLLVFRALQAAGGAAALLAAFHVLDAGESRIGHRLWLGAGLVGTAAGPAIGGALTEAFDWRAIFAVQAPLAAAAALATFTHRERAPEPAPAASEPAPPPRAGLWAGADPREGGEPRPGGESREGGAGAWRGGEPGERGAAWAAGAPRAGGEPREGGAGAWPGGAASAAGAPRPAGAPRGAPELAPLAALALVAAAFTAVLFLLVLELVAGFALSPLRAALGVTVLPLAALGAAALPGPPRARALAGAVFLAGGAAALAFLPAPTIAWTIVPPLLAGAGMGLALPAFSGQLLPERDVAEAARQLVARHAGIVVVLAILAPVATQQLGEQTEQAILKGASLVLDAQIDPLQKLQLAPALLDGVDADSPRAGLHDAVAERRDEFQDDAAVYDRLARRLDDVVVGAVQSAFRSAYLIAAALALLAAALTMTRARRPAILAATAVAAATVAVYAYEHHEQRPPDVTFADPCRERAIPDSGGLGGFLQGEVLRTLDSAACKLGSTREELALALFDPERARKFQAQYGVDPRSAGGLLSLLGG